MKKILEFFFILFLFALVSFISGCGVEFSDNDTGNRKIKVTIPFDLSEKSFQKQNQINYSNLIYGPAPSNIRSIRVEVLYPNGVKISKYVDVAGGVYVEVNMELDEGTNIFFYAFAYDGYGGTGNLLYSGASPPQTLKNNMSYEVVINMSPARTPPSVVSVTPSNGATGVGTNTLISATFSEAMDPTTINTTTFMISGGAAGTVTYSGQTATFSPSTNLMPNTNYTVTITTGVKNSLGISISSNYTWSFTTGASADTTPPTIISVTPAHGATGVPKDSIVTIIFSEAMDPTTLTVSAGGSETIKFTPSGWTPTINYSGTTATLSSPMQFFTNTTYTFTITTGVKDLAGNAMASSYTWSFTTTAGTAPSVMSASPSNGATGVAINTSISVTFSEGIDTSTINTSTFTVNGGAGNIAGSISTSTTTPTVATFTPSVSLNPSTTYTATITTGVKNWVGVAITSNYSWSFTTGGGGDTTPPTVSSVTPANGSTNVPTSSIVTIIFSEAMDPTTLTVTAGGSETIKFTPSGWTPTVNYSGTTATLTSPMQFFANTSYTFTITTGVKDAAGNAMTSSYSWIFTTAP